jgi:hypothetical protein
MSGSEDPRCDVLWRGWRSLTHPLLLRALRAFAKVAQREPGPSRMPSAIRGEIGSHEATRHDDAR